MADIPYGYRMNGGKLAVAPDELAVLKYVFEANECYIEQPSICGEVVVDGSRIYVDGTEICIVSDFVKGFVTAEVNALYQFWKERLKEVPEFTMPELINEEGIAAKIRQSLVAYNIENFCHGVYDEAMGLVRCAAECYAGKVEAVKM